MNPNAIKFTEVFVNLVEDGKVLNDSSNFDFRLKQTKPNYETYRRNWEDFINSKMDSMDEDRFDDWFENLTFEDIDPRDIYKYKLPEEPITIDTKLGVSHLLKIANLLRKTYEESKSLVTNNDSCILDIDLSTKQLLIQVIMTGNTNTQIKQLFKTTKNTTENIIDSLKEEAGISRDNKNIFFSRQGLKIDSKCTPEENEERAKRLQDIDDNNISFFFTIQIDESSFRPSKNKKFNGNVIDFYNYIDSLFKYMPVYSDTNNSSKYADKLRHLTCI